VEPEIQAQTYILVISNLDPLFSTILQATWMHIYSAHIHLEQVLCNTQDHIPVTSSIDNTKLEDVQFHSEDFPPADDPFEDAVFNE